MRVVIIVLLLCPFFCAAAQELDAAALLGMKLDQVRALYSGDCGKLHPARYANETKTGSLQSCNVKHHPKRLFEEKVSHEMLFFRDQQVIEVDFTLKGGIALTGIAKAYGKPDPPLDPRGSSYRFGTSTYDDGNSTTTLDGAGESHLNVEFWTKPHFRIEWSSSEYMSWDDMAHRDNDVLGGLFYKPSVTEKVVFISIP